MSSTQPAPTNATRTKVKFPKPPTRQARLRAAYNVFEQAAAAYSVGELDRGRFNVCAARTREAIRGILLDEARERRNTRGRLPGDAAREEREAAGDGDPRDG